MKTFSPFCDRDALAGREALAAHEGAVRAAAILEEELLALA